MTLVVTGAELLAGRCAQFADRGAGCGNQFHAERHGFEWFQFVRRFHRQRPAHRRNSDVQSNLGYRFRVFDSDHRHDDYGNRFVHINDHWHQRKPDRTTTVTLFIDRSGGRLALPGLVGYWTFNEGSGTTAADSSGNNLTATLSNGVSWATGKVGGAISANGSNQYVTIPAINLSSTSAASVAMWVNRTYTNGAGDVLFEFSNNFNSTRNAFGFFPEGAADCGVPATEISLVGQQRI